MGGPLVSYVFIARRPLRMQGGTRQPGELVPEAADWKGKVRQAHLDLGWIEEFAVMSDDDREAFHAQWEAEEAARQEAVKNAPQPEGPKPSTPQPRPRQHLCANCGAVHSWEEPPADHQWFQCSRCHQRQTVGMARQGSLRMYTPAFNHNRKAPTFRQEN